MSDSDVLIRCENVSKKFCRDLKRSLWYGVKDSATDLFRLRNDATPRLRKDEFWANKDISFELKRGECLGLIGRNGAGKTTLLKMLNGLIKPDSGQIEIKGRVGALIALGAGFNPILTGRENIYVNGSILGLSKKKIDEKFEHIVEFSELAEFIDSPVRTYSSGMNVRLGFAVAVVLIQPDVLLLDEVLAVGDNAFRTKCLNIVTESLKNAAVIFVSHSETQIKRICNQALLLVKGTTELHSADVFEAFLSYNQQGALTESCGHNPLWVTPRADVLSHSIIPDVSTLRDKIQSTDPLTLRIRARAKQPLNECLARLIARSSSGDVVAAFEADFDGGDTKAGDDFELVFQIDSLKLATGYYSFGFFLHDRTDLQVIFKTPELFSVSVIARFVHGGLVNMDAQVSLRRIANSAQHGVLPKT